MPSQQALNYQDTVPTINMCMVLLTTITLSSSKPPTHSHANHQVTLARNRTWNFHRDGCVSKHHKSFIRAVVCITHGVAIYTNLLATRINSTSLVVFNYYVVKQTQSYLQCLECVYLNVTVELSCFCHVLRA